MLLLAAQIPEEQDEDYIEPNPIIDYSDEDTDGEGQDDLFDGWWDKIF